MRSILLTTVACFLFAINTQAQCWQYITAGGVAHTVAIKDDGTLRAWGLNDCGQVGDGTDEDRYAPLQIDTTANWQQVDAELYHAVTDCARIPVRLPKINRVVRQMR